MASPFSVLAPGIAAGGIPATAKISVNTRVQTATGPIGVIADMPNAMLAPLINSQKTVCTSCGMP